MNTIPNLDCMSSEDLMQFWLKYRRPKRVEAEALIGDRRKGFTVLCGSLAGYASNKATAQTCRLKGDIQAATIYECICENIYSELPDDLKW